MKRPLLVLAFVVLLAGSALAIPIPGIPGGPPMGVTQLGVILATLYRIERVVGHMKELSADIKAKLEDVYPDKVIRHIPVYFEPVKSLKQELSELSQLWSFSPRVDRLRRALYEGGDFCRDDLHSIYGLPPITADADLEELEDFQAVTDVKVLSDAVDNSQEWADTAHWLMNETQQGTPYGDPSLKYSPGYSDRLAAMAAAQLGMFMAQSGKLQQRELELAHMRFLHRKRQERYVVAFTRMGYAAMAGQGAAGIASAGTPPGDGGL